MYCWIIFHQTVIIYLYYTPDLEGRKKFISYGEKLFIIIYKYVVMLFNYSVGKIFCSSQWGLCSLCLNVCETHSIQEDMLIVCPITSKGFCTIM